MSDYILLKELCRIMKEQGACWHTRPSFKKEEKAGRLSCLRLPNDFRYFRPQDVEGIVKAYSAGGSRSYHAK